MKAGVAASERDAGRRVVRRTKGNRRGPITRLMSPSDLGEVLKPFVFLDLVKGADLGGPLQRAMGLHPHSGIATVTVVTRGDLRFDDPQAGTGTIAHGGVEWMRASSGVWHGREMTRGTSATIDGFQLWLALSPELELAEPDSQYVEAKDIPRIGPARLIVGAYGGASSPVRAPAGINYLLIALKPGQDWRYLPPEGHSIGWLALSEGEVELDGPIRAGEMVALDRSEMAISLRATGTGDAIFVLGSAQPHPHALHLGSHSVHTSPAALVAGERRIAELAGRIEPLRSAGEAAAGEAAAREAAKVIPVIR